MLELFRIEAENHAATLSGHLLELEKNPTDKRLLEGLMRAAHSLKGAAQIVGLPEVSKLAHAMEDCFVAAQREQLTIGQNETDVLLRGVDVFRHISKLAESEMARWETDRVVDMNGLMAEVSGLVGSEDKPAAPMLAPAPLAEAFPKETENLPPPSRALDVAEQGFLRVTSDIVNRLLGLAGESLVESRRLQPLAGSLIRLKRLHQELTETLSSLRDSLATCQLPERAALQLAELTSCAGTCQEYLHDRIEELDAHDRRSMRVSNRLYQEALRVRMRPFGDGVAKFPRMVRDLARSLNKEIRLEIAGNHTEVDRDILEKLDAPLTHLIRNAVDHGCEFPAERERHGKPREAVVKVEARHRAGMLMVSVGDDGPGVDLGRLRAAIVRQNLVAEEVADELRESELLEFLFLPGFTTKEHVTEISGRGVGLDVLREMVGGVRGKISVQSKPGQGVRFQLQLPISLAVMRALLVEVDGEPYALPLARVVQAAQVGIKETQLLAGRLHWCYADQPVALVSARQLFGRGLATAGDGDLTVVVMGERNSLKGLIVDKLMSERELVILPLDARLGKIRDVSAASLMEDGSPVLILDADDLARSMDKEVSGARLPQPTQTSGAAAKVAGRILVVDDSITVREMYRKLLTSHGYVIELAMDGMDGLNMARSGRFDLVISDVDMPRMDGLEMVSRLRRMPELRATPALMVSHKDREQDRQRGIAAGANEYMTKSGFREETLLEMVRKLIDSAHHK